MTILKRLNPKIYPKAFLQTDKGGKNLYEKYLMNGFNGEKNKLPLQLFAQNLYNENLSVVVVSDHNTISGIEGKITIKLVSTLSQEK